MQVSENQLAAAERATAVGREMQQIKAEMLEVTRLLGERLSVLESELSNALRQILEPSA